MEYPVHTVEDAYDVCHPEEPLLSGDPRYLALNAARGDEDLAARISFRVTNTKTSNFHQTKTVKGSLDKLAKMKQP